MHNCHSQYYPRLEKCPRVLSTREFTPPNGKEPSPLVGTKPLFFRNCFRSCSSPAELSRLCSARSSVAAAFSVLVVLVPLGAASAADAVSTRSLAVDANVNNNNSDNKLLLTVVLIRDEKRRQTLLKEAVAQRAVHRSSRAYKAAGRQSTAEQTEKDRERLTTAAQHGRRSLKNWRTNNNSAAFSLFPNPKVSSLNNLNKAIKQTIPKAKLETQFQRQAIESTQSAKNWNAQIGTY
ncbi:hypothetical protein T12_10890 [Trichinella patagoniensis]|uniref:Uncharacterized protein n=1 Tax=Trichinella patagoniensis TaxID=990121 RepID=A0A0V0Z877_9BILA|nr:hypothetical protein T12_10890 [Trichinella patagoniensis]